jgi:hypothetical protein
MLTISTVKTRLSYIQAAISGVKRAFVDAPMSLAEADLPLFCTFLGPATNDYEEFGDGEVLSARDYLMRLYVAPVQSGEDGEAEKAVETFVAPVYAAFQARPGLSSATTGHTAPLAGVMKSWIISDNGAAVLPFAGVNFLGVEFRLRVWEVASYTLATGE